jgi:predicted transcriptional regulator
LEDDEARAEPTPKLIFLTGGKRPAAASGRRSPPPTNDPACFEPDLDKSPAIIFNRAKESIVDTRVVTAHIPIGLADRIDELASRSERSRGWIVKQALGAWIDQEDERHRWTLEALAEVDARQLIDDKAVQDWAASLGSPNPLPPPEC